MSSIYKGRLSISANDGETSSTKVSRILYPETSAEQIINLKNTVTTYIVNTVPSILRNNVIQAKGFIVEDTISSKDGSPVNIIATNAVNDINNNAIHETYETKFEHDKDLFELFVPNGEYQGEVEILPDISQAITNGIYKQRMDGNYYVRRGNSWVTITVPKIQMQELIEKVNSYKTTIQELEARIQELEEKTA